MNGPTLKMVEESLSTAIHHAAEASRRETPSERLESAHAAEAFARALDWVVDLGRSAGTKPRIEQ